MAKKLPFKNSDAAYAKAFNAGDAAKISALYSKDAIFMMPETPPYKGTKGVREAGIDAGWRNMEFRKIKSARMATLLLTSAASLWISRRMVARPR